MVIYRPHRGGFAEAMAEAQEFSSGEEMLAYIVAELRTPRSAQRLRWRTL